ncbi:MAG: endonuclease/exonuclease/phosphatase family protein [Pseudomonadota bacterium]
MRLFRTRTIDALPPVPDDLRAAIENAERTPTQHRTLFERLEALHLIEAKFQAVARSALPADITVAAWNVERCLDPQGSATLLAKHDPDIILLSEMDAGMARTGQRNATREVAHHLGMGYAFGVEFFEMGLGSALEQELASETENALGWHGNAIVAKTSPSALALIRLDDHGHWFCENPGVDASQPRIGGRMAIAATFETVHGTLCAVSTHLESAGSVSIRQSQMDRIMAAVDQFAPGAAVIIGGDLNTGNNLAEGLDWQSETLFEAAERQNYSWTMNPAGTTTRPSRLTRFPDRAMKLDWFAARDVKAQMARIVPALDAENTPLSDHELIVCQLNLEPQLTVRPQQ